MIDLNQSVLEKGCEFLISQTPRTFSLEFVRPGGGWFTLRRPTVVVALPADEKSNHASSLIAMFHEYGHWLDMRARLDAIRERRSIDRDVAYVLSKSELDQNEVQKYLRRRSPNEEIVSEYYEYLLNEGIVVGKIPLVESAVMKHEERAWELGYDGLALKDGLHRGFADFVKSCDDILQKPAALDAYSELRDSMLDSYRQSFVKNKAA